MLPCICIDVCLCLAGVSEVLSSGAAQSDVTGCDRVGGVDAGLHQRLAGSSAVPEREREKHKNGAIITQSTQTQCQMTVHVIDAHAGLMSRLV